MRLEIAPARSSASCRVTMPSQRPSTPADAPLEYAQQVRCAPSVPRHVGRRESSAVYSPGGADFKLGLPRPDGAI